MGDMIEGPTDCRRITYGSAVHRSPDRTSSRGISSWRVFWVLMTLGFALLAGAMWKQAVESERFSLKMVGKCFATAVGARGMVETSDGRTGSVTMIFPSGLRETYLVEGLDDIPCSLLTEYDNAKGATR